MPLISHPIRSTLAMAAGGMCLLASSCIDGDEQVTVRGDGSGEASVTYVVPTAAVIANGGADKLRQTIVDWLDGNPRLDLRALEVSEQGDRTRVHARIEFDSALALVDLSSKDKLTKLPAAVRDLAGTLDFRLRGRRFEVTRTVQPRAALGGALMFARRSDLANHRLVYQIHLPTPADSHNATATRDNGRTLVWDFSLAAALDSPPEIRFAATMPLPAKFWGGVGLAVAIAAGLGAVALRGFRRRRGRRRSSSSGLSER